MKVFVNLDRYSGEVPLEHWVSRIAINTCLSQIKAERLRPELRWADLGDEERRILETLATTAEELHPADSLAAREIVGILLDQLAPGDRLVLTLLHLEGRSVEEAALLTGWSHTRIRVRAFRARQKLKKRFHKLMEDQ